MGKMLYVIRLVPLPLFTLTDTLRKSDLPMPLASKGMTKYDCDRRPPSTPPSLCLRLPRQLVHLPKTSIRCFMPL